MRLVAVPPGARGFDLDEPLTPASARAFRAHGYRFAARYIPRTDPDGVHPHDLTPAEVSAICDAGLMILPVQHVESADSWIPSADKGNEYGATAAIRCADLGIIDGAAVACDLEGVALGTPASAVIAFARMWYTHVANAGFRPMLYVGWHAGLTPQQLFDLPFRSYWGAYNLNADEEPATRGLAIKQHERQPGDVPAGVTLSRDFDTNTVRVDKLGGLPVMAAPDDWKP
jgi:hypothetical protein